MRKHRKTIFFILSRFWSLRNRGVWMNPLKIKNLWRRSFFKIMLNEVLKQIQYFLKCNVKRACICHLILVGILFILILPVKNSGWVLRRGGGGGVINRRNLLSVMKVIFRQSLKLVGLSCYLKNKEKKSSCNFLEGLISFLNWLIFSESFYFSFYVLLAISTRLNKNHLHFRI